MPVIEHIAYTATAHDIDRFAESWVRVSDYDVRESSKVPEALTELWGVEPSAHPRQILLACPGSEFGALRLVETDLPGDDALPDTRHGPYGFEFLSRDVDEVHRRMVEDGAFDVIAPPLEFDMGQMGGGAGRSIAARGPGGIWMLVTTTTSVPAPRPLPSTPHLAGPVMNLPITGGDRDAGLRLYGDLLGMPLRFDHTYADPGMNRILGLPEDRVMAWTIFSIGDGRLCDHHYPEDFVPEPPLVHPGRLRPGAAGHTFVVD